MPSKNEIDETGKRYGMLVGIRKVGSKDGAVWLYQCDCGNLKEAKASHVRYGQVRSCGCNKGNKGMKFHKDLTGNKYGNLTVLREYEIARDEKIRYVVRCDCGREFVELGYFLTSGKITKCQSCANATHHMSYTKIYKKWVGMKMRCYSKNHPSYKDYGGRGITICDEWLKPENFIEWAFQNGYNENEDGWEYSIDRIDVDKGYSPDNCRFVNRKRQMRNRRNTRYVEYEGEKMPVSDVSEITGISYDAIIFRLNRGWSDYEATHTKNARGSNAYNTRRVKND